MQEAARQVSVGRLPQVEHQLNVLGECGEMPSFCIVLTPVKNNTMGAFCAAREPSGGPTPRASVSTVRQ